MSIVPLLPKPPAVPATPTTGDLPTVELAIAWSTDPLETPSYTDVSGYARQINVTRGRSYEYDRPETGVASYTLDNRDSRFDPDNASGPYYPNVKPTRRVRVNAEHDGVVYPVMEAFSEGYPNAFPGAGFDAVVHQSASDWFYPLNTIKFAPGTTTLAQSILTTPAAGTQETVFVTSTALPLPQAFPFLIQIGRGAEFEQMEVTASAAPGEWTVTRGEGGTVVAHLAGDEVRSEVVRFGEELSGARINNCLDMLGVVSVDRDIDGGNSTIAASGDLVGTSILEHLLLVAEAENGRLFASREGKITFRERHWQFTDELDSRATFGAGAGEVPYLAQGENVLAHEDAKLYNRVRITLTSGEIVEASDQDSIDAHFERVLEKQWPLASAIEAQDAADYMLARLKEARLRVPSIRLRPRADTHIATVLETELAQRYRLKMDPPVGSTVLDREVILERVAHSFTPGDWVAAFEFSEADVTTYWRVEETGYSELDSTTRLAY